MAEYVFIQNYSRNGKMGISNNVFDQIAEIATNTVKGASVRKSKSKQHYQLHKPITSSIKNGLVEVKIDVIMKKGVNVRDVSIKIQEEVASALSMMTEIVPFKILVEVSGIE